MNPDLWKARLGASRGHLVVMRDLLGISSEVSVCPLEGSASSKCIVVFSVTLPTDPTRQPPASGSDCFDDSLAPSTVGMLLRFRSLRSCNKPRGVYNSSISSLSGRKKNMTGSNTRSMRKVSSPLPASRHESLT